VGELMQRDRSRLGEEIKSAPGGMLPITYALLAECMPVEHRGWTLVLVGAFGLIGGWFAASGCATLLEPHFGWRILWFLNAPTGIILIFCNKLIPESPRAQRRNPV
jgi:putative MFS transporter